jgi:hypothetical protein
LIAVVLTACGGGADPQHVGAADYAQPDSSSGDTRAAVPMAAPAGDREVAATVAPADQQTAAASPGPASNGLAEIRDAVEDSNLQRLEAAWTSMTTANEILPKGIAPTAGWRHGAKVHMGTEPYGHAIPTWWTPGIRFDEWRAMSSWFVIYPDDGAAPVANTVVEINGMETWVLRTSVGIWQRLQSNVVPNWQGNFRLGGGGQIGPAYFRSTPTGSRVYRPGTDYMVHAGLGQVSVPWRNDTGADLKAIYLSVRHRLAVADPKGADVRHLAKFGVAVGVDYFPWLGATLEDMQANYVPSAGVGQFQSSTTEWRRAAILITKEGLTEAELYAPRPPAFRY